MTNDFTTTVDADNRTVRVQPVTLDTLQRVDEAQLVRGGTTPSVNVDTQFDPLAVGTTTISITQPPGFLPPAGRTSIVATVEPG